jgi:hypothetical protein
VESSRFGERIESQSSPALRHRGGLVGFLSGSRVLKCILEIESVVSPSPVPLHRALIRLRLSACSIPNPPRVHLSLSNMQGALESIQQVELSMEATPRTVWRWTSPLPNWSPPTYLGCPAVHERVYGEPITHKRKPNHTNAEKYFFGNCNIN